MWPGADNSFRNALPIFERKNKKFRNLIYFFLSSFAVSIMSLLNAGLTVLWEGCPGTIMFVLIFITSILVGVLTGRISVFTNAAGGWFHTSWGFILMFLSIYIYFSVFWGSWNFFSTLKWLGDIDFEIYFGLLISLLAFIWIPFVCNIYGWSSTEQKISRELLN